MIFFDKKYDCKTIKNMIKKPSTASEIWWTLVSPINYLRGNWRVVKYMWGNWREKYHSDLHPLYLVKLHLKRLPFLLRFVHVKDLLLGDNRLSNLPKWLAQKQNIKLLGLSSNYFTAIPSVIFELKKLESFYIGSNDLRQIPERLRTLPELNNLSIYDCNLSEFPRFILDWKILEYLDISDNIKITDLPEEIGRLNLNCIYLEGTSIQSLPISMLEMDLVRKAYALEPYEGSWTDEDESINVSVSNLSFPAILEEKIKNNCSVDYWMLGDCFRLLIAIAPKEEFSTYLIDFWNKRFEYLFHGKEESINIAGPNINGLAIDWSLIQVPHLKRLSIDSTIIEIPEEIGKLNNLEWLSIKSYKISALPNSFIQLTNLEYFSMHYEGFPFEVDIPRDTPPQEEIRQVLDLQAHFHRTR